MTGRAFLSRYGIIFIFLAKNETNCCILKDEITCQRDPLTKSMCVYFCERGQPLSVDSLRAWTAY
jgi:hypothetical protein